jgi:hypothetical protein
VNTPELRGSTPLPEPLERHADLSGDLRVVARSMHDAFDDQVGPDVVEVEVQRVADRFVQARIRMYVPLFVRRFAGQALRERTGPHFTAGRSPTSD